MCLCNASAAAVSSVSEKDPSNRVTAPRQQTQAQSAIFEKRMEALKQVSSTVLHVISLHLKRLFKNEDL